MTDLYGRGTYDRHPRSRDSNASWDSWRSRDRPRNSDTQPDRPRNSGTLPDRPRNSDTLPDRPRHFDASLRDREEERRADRSRDAHSRPRDLIRSPPLGKPGQTAPSSSVRQESAGDRNRTAPDPRDSERPHGTPATAKQSVPIAKSPSTASAKQSGIKPEVKRFIESCSDRIYWFMHWEAADKKLKQLQADHKRCKSSLSDFPSANDILLQQGHVAEIEKAKYSKRLEEAEGKLQTAVHDLFAKLRSAKTEESTKSQSSGALGNHTNGSAESQSSFTKTIVDETSVLKKTMQTEFDTKTAELGAQLRLERDKNEQLQKRLEALEQRMDVQEKESRSGIRQAPKQVDNQPAGTVSGQQEDIEMPEVEDAGVEENISEPTVEADSFISRKQLDDILREFDERISCCESTIDRSQEQQSGETPPGEQMAQKLRSMISTLRSLELSVGQEDIVEISKGMQELSRRVDSHTGAMEELSKAHAENASVIKAIKPSSTGQPADQPAMNTAKEVEPLLASTTQLSGHVGKAIEVEVDKRLRDLVPLLCNKVNEFLRQEEGKIESMVRSAKDLAKDGSLLRADLDKLSAEVVSSREKFDSLARLTPNAVAEVKPGVEELAMQIRTLQSWQDNFTTRPLYKEIVDHITATLPNGVLNQLQVLGSRIEGIEYRLEATEEGEALKRRKMTPAGLRAADGSQ